MGLTISNPRRMARVEQDEHAVGTEAAEDIPDLQAPAVAFLLVVPQVMGHLEAAPAVE